MTVDRNRIAAILAQSDEELLPRVRAVLEVLGVDGEGQAKLLEDTALLRQRASEISEFDLYRARLLIGEEQLENILRVLERQDG